MKIRNEIPSKDGMMFIPDELHIIVTTVQELIDPFYPEIAKIQYKPTEWFCEGSTRIQRTKKLRFQWYVAEVNNNLTDTVCNADDTMNYLEVLSAQSIFHTIESL